MATTNTLQPRTGNNPMLPVNATPVEMRRDADRFPRICRMAREDAVVQMLHVVEAAALYRGQRLDADELGFTAAALVDEILSDKRWGLPWISFAEIRTAVRTAVLEKDMYGVNVSSIFRALVDYARGDGNAAARVLDIGTARASAARTLMDASAAEMITTQHNGQ